MVTVKNLRRFCGFDINTAAPHVVTLPLRREEKGRGKVISAHDSELIVKLWHAGLGPLSTTDG